MKKVVRIEKIIAGGFGLARQIDGPVLLTRFVLPGETVLVREIKTYRGYCEAEPVEVIEPSPDRTEPICPLFTRCGGCDLQHGAYEAQLTIKHGIVSESLQRSGISFSPQLLHPTIPSPARFHYRNRIRLKVSEEGRVGFFKTGSNDLVAVTACPVAENMLNTMIRELNRPGLLTGIAPDIRELEIQLSPADNSVFILASPGSGPQNGIDALAEFGRTLPGVCNISLKEGDTVRDVYPGNVNTSLRQNFDRQVAGEDFSLSWSPGCFSQVNAGLNSLLIGHVLDLAGDLASKQVLDLFCGMGNFSIPIALRGARVTGVERSRESIARAVINSKEAGLETIRFVANDVLAEVDRYAARSQKQDIIVLDPPRQGLGPKISTLARLGPAKIIYISCDPATLSRDLAFLAKNGYGVADITPFDMFPQTHHIETVALLEKN